MTDSIETRRERQRKHLAAWRERVEIARRDGNGVVASAAHALAEKYRELVESASPEPEPASVAAANLLRRKIEAAEQHRTMSVEHGLGDEAIDVTLEIQEMERELVALVRVWQQQEN